MLWVSFAYPLQAFKNGLWIVELKGHPYPPLSYSNTQPNKNAIHNVLLSEAAKDYRSNKKSWSDWSGHTLYSCHLSYSCNNLRTTIHSVLSTKKIFFLFTTRAAAWSSYAYHCCCCCCWTWGDVCLVSLILLHFCCCFSNFLSSLIFPMCVIIFTGWSFTILAF